MNVMMLRQTARMPQDWKNILTAVLLPMTAAVLLVGYLTALYPDLSTESQAAALSITVLSVGLLLFIFGRLALQNRFARTVRLFYEKLIVVILFAASLIAVLTTIGIVLSLIFESLEFFRKIPIGDFLFGLEWSPQSAFHYKEKTAGVDFKFGAVPVIFGTLAITFLAVLLAVVIGLGAAIYLSEYAGGVRAILKPVLEILAGIPTVVYGFFAALTIAPVVKHFGVALGISASAESALAVSFVMGIMLIPFISSLSDDVFRAVPQSLRDASFAMGATQYETITRVLLPAAMPGLVGAVLLAVSRAIGETMIVLMAAGLAANLTFNPFASVTTVTVQIVTLLVGDQEFDSPKTLAAFALGLLLFVMTLLLNVIALWVRQRFTKEYA